MFCYLVTIWQKANHHVGDSNISISIQETGQPHSCSLCEPVSWYSASSWCWWDLSISSSVLSLASTASPVGPVLRCYHPLPFTSKLTLSLCVDISSLSCPPCFFLIPFKNPLQHCAKTHYCTINTQACKHSHTDIQIQLNAQIAQIYWGGEITWISHTINSGYGYITMWVCSVWWLSSTSLLPYCHFLLCSLSLPVYLCPCHHTGNKSCAGECVCVSC